ncbi:hypothetical protein DACRYDRAFT_103960 [Dacryopinax primogenitus]|uniref:EI24-domain-containing protein n=1 Tax=Dacryopinax primogenitus (strain DJM 731) TaxID=1858805 RepID=M5GEJ5_DACPD|nr:uncharacterized protein DACRYDRAFT_103960 [Dacryopinax primogenitus]EJU05472.1 hypothetical protein DACRYDRAFT_103960 [Dacryopinax primogenitus]
MSSPATRRPARLRPQPSSSSSSSPAPRSPSFLPSGLSQPSNAQRLPSRPSHPSHLSHSSHPSYGPGNASTYAYTDYPRFLTLWETASLHASWALHGLWDAFRWDHVFRFIQEPEIQKNVLKSLLLNGLSLISIFTFEWLLLPLLPHNPSYQRNLGTAYQVLWLWPVVGASLWFNSIWSTTIARKAFLLQHGQAPVPDTPSYGGVLNSIASSAYRLIFLLSYLFLQLCLAYLPVMGKPAGFVFTCWVNSYYSFEFVNIARGLTLSERIKQHEERWAYYLFFGLPSAALCMWGSSLANAASYALLFPAYNIMSMPAHPLPRHPYAPHPSPSAGGQPALLSPYIPIRIPVFTPVILVNEVVVRALSVGTRTRRGTGGRPAAGSPVRGKRWGTQAMELTEEGTEVDTFRPRRKLD